MDKYTGKRLDGRYEIHELVGVGGMALVYRAYDLLDQRIVAIKILKDEFLHNAEFIRRFKNESKAIALLSHPYIIQVYDVSFGDQIQYIVEEFIDGITLRQYLDQQTEVNLQEAIHFTVEILQALQHAHERGIVHRDIKPQNIMVLPNGHIKVTDFGIARFARSETRTITDKAIGSVHYIAPEQARGDLTDEKADIYSVGVMLYEMLSGSLPFDGSGTVSIAIMQISEKPKPLAQVAPNVPEGLRQITEKAMEKDPDDRYQSAAEMLQAIQAFKQNPSIRFEYEYNTQDAPSKTINKVVSGGRSGTKSGISTQQARRTDTMTGKGKNVKKTAARKPVKEKHFSVLPIFFGMAVAFIIGATILVYLIFTNSTNPLFSNRDNVQLIDFVGQTEDEFRTSDYFALLTPEIVYEYNSSYPAGTIFQQSPAAGRTVKEKQKITLKVSRGTEIITLPDVGGYDKNTAKQTLVDLGVSVTTRRETNDSVAEGTVIRTEPAAGSSVEGGSTVVLYVAKPTRVTTASVPSVEGLDETAARNAINTANLVPAVREVNSDQPAGTVIEQNPSAGDTVSLYSVVVLYVSTGVPEVVATPAPAEPNGDPNTIIQEWYDEVPEGSGNWVRRYLTGDGVTHNDDGSVYTG